MFILKGCAKCHGDLALDIDLPFNEWKCIQCSRRFVAVKSAKGARQRNGAQLALSPYFASSVVAVGDVSDQRLRYRLKRR